MHVRAGIYCRISQDRDGRALGVARQERDCRRIATERKWNVVDVYIDNDRSASKRNVHRPEYERLLADITNHRIDAVVVWNLDRLTRQPRQLESFVDVCEEAGMTRFATVTGDVNLTTADGITLARITGAFAAGEVRKISDRVKRKALEVAEHGRPWGGGRHPIGFAANRIDHDPIAAPALHDAARAILDGSTIVDAARTLIDRGVLNPPDHRAATVLKRVLCSPRVTGLREYKGEIVGTAVWDPIIDRPTWEQLRAVLQRPSRYSVPHRRHLLSGLARCGECGTVLQAQVRHHEGDRIIYVCRTGKGGCGRVGVDGGRLEAHVLDQVGRLLRTAKFRRAAERHFNGTGTDRGRELARSIEADERRLAELAGQVGELQLTVGEWQAMRAPIVRRIEQARSELARTQRPHRRRIDLAAAAAAWDVATPEEQRDLLHVLLGEVSVARVGKAARRFDPARAKVRAVWEEPALTG